MIPRGALRRHLPLTAAVLALAWALAPASAPASSGAGELSPRLAELAKPALREASGPAQSRAVGLAAQGPASLLRQGGRLLVEVRFETGTPVPAGDLRAAGGRVVHISRRYRTVTVAARPADLRAIAGVEGVGGVTEVLTPVTSATSCTGLVTSEGDFQLEAFPARRDFNVDGSGVSVGILSDSFDTAAGVPTRAADDVASGDLPGPANPCGRTTPVNRLDDSYVPADPPPSDQGRAMAQAIHDLAPGAALSFATARSGELDFAAKIRNLAKAGAKVIVDDVTYFEEPFFQDGPVAAAVNEAAAAGVAYFSAAGNNNLIPGDRDIASWEAPAFRDSSAESPSASCPTGLPAYADHCMDFNSSTAVADPTFGITVEANSTLRVGLQWQQPWNGVTTDLDPYLLLGGVLLTPTGGNELRNVVISQKPVELVTWTNESSSPQTVQLAINRCDNACDGLDGGDDEAPRLKFILLQDGGGVSATEYESSSNGDLVGPTIFGHGAAAGAISVGAVPYNNSSTVEPYSSRGPVTHYFGPVTGGGAAVETGPKTIFKPDLAATDCGLSTFFSTTFLPSPLAGIPRFGGTSAAAAHAAAVAALMREANPSLSLGQLRTGLATTARPVGSFGAGAAGAGLIDAYGAVSRVALPPKVTITQAPPPLSKNRLPSFGFTANRPASFSCTLDGSPFFPCSAPFVPSNPLADGEHGFAVRAVDLAGRIGTSETVSFRIDTRRPRTFIRVRPRKNIRTRKRRVRVVFAFRSNEDDVDFVCRANRGLYRFCKRRIVRKFGAGRHTLRVKAVDQAGNADQTPAVYRFRIKRVG